MLFFFLTTRLPPTHPCSSLCMTLTHHMILCYTGEALLVILVRLWNKWSPGGRRAAADWQLLYYTLLGGRRRVVAKRVEAGAAGIVLLPVMWWMPTRGDLL